RRAEAAKMQVLLDHVAAARQAYANEPGFVQDDAERAAVHQAALVLGFSDHSTASALHTGEYARHHLPRCWEAFCRGLIDLLRLGKISTAAQNLTDEHLIHRLDPVAALEAIDRSLASFTHWLSRYTTELDYQAH